MQWNCQPVAGRDRKESNKRIVKIRSFIDFKMSNTVNGSILYGWYDVEPVYVEHAVYVVCAIYYWRERHMHMQEVRRWVTLLSTNCSSSRSLLVCVCGCLWSVWKVLFNFLLVSYLAFVRIENIIYSFICHMGVIRSTNSRMYQKIKAITFFSQK